MFIAKELRKKSIAEYLLYMWQVEDLIRAYGCNLARIRREYISQFDYPDEEKEELTDWYGNLIRMINEEGRRESGHLQINKIVVQDITELHARLLDSARFPFYRAVELRKRGGNTNESEIETCLNALYGVMMLRLQNKKISPDTQHAIQEISTLIGMLSDYYLKDKTEGIDFDDSTF